MPVDKDKENVELVSKQVNTNYVLSVSNNDVNLKSTQILLMV